MMPDVTRPLCHHWKRNAPFLFAWRHHTSAGAATMRYNQLGNTGMFVSELCLGTMTFGAAGENAQWGLIASLDQKGVNDIVARSIAAGVNFFDTADVYSFGQSERLLGQSLKDLGVKRSDVVIA